VNRPASLDEFEILARTWAAPDDISATREAACQLFSAITEELAARS
jgi:hypothetical protein